MSVYKVPQDVEADDKLLGPFSFRQFIYLVIVAVFGFAGFWLYQIYPGLIIIPIPFMIFFGVLALPLRKDQPMEAYLAAVLSFYIKPNKRTWQADGIEHLIEISAPVQTEDIRLKTFGQDEASRRLSYLADIVDTEGWAIKHAVAPDTHSNFQHDFKHETTSTAQNNDIFENNRVANNIDTMLATQNNLRKQQILENINTARNLADFTDLKSDEIQANTYKRFDPADLYRQSLNRAEQNRNPNSQPEIETNQQLNQIDPWARQQITSNQYNISSQSYNTISQTAEIPQDSKLSSIDQTENIKDDDFKLQFNPYPNSIRQSIIKPLSEQPKSINQPKQELDPEIMRLVSEGKDLSVETLARQANKIKKRGEIDLNSEKEVVISLR